MGPYSPLSRITNWLDKISHKLRALNDCSIMITTENAEKVKRDTLEVKKEVVILWLNVIMTFRSQGLGHQGKLI